MGGVWLLRALTCFGIMLCNMRPTRICHNCEQRLLNASDAMRRHASLMSKAMRWSRTEHTDELRREFEANLVTTFNDAQAAWDAYREHVVEHGLLPSA